MPVCNDRIGNPAFQRIYPARRAKSSSAILPGPGSLNGAKQSVEVIAAGVLGKLVARVYFETVTLTKISVDERGQKVTPCGLLLCGLLLFRVVLVTSTSDDLTGQDARIGLDDDPIRIAALQMRDRHPRRRETGCSFEEHEADGYTV